MATRGTYTLSNEDCRIGLYIHWDSYPEGAAQYFKAALDIAPNFKIENFIRANKRAEITIPNLHSDREYHYYYNMEFNNIIVLHFDISDGGKSIEFSGTLEDFLMKNGVKVLKEDKGLYTADYVQARLKDAVITAAAYKAKFPEMIGNIHSNEREIKRLQELLERIPS